MVGIVGYGAYVPHHYILADEISGQANNLGLGKKALADWDEDSVTMAVEAGRRALVTAGINAADLGAVYVGSESPPYAVNPMSTIVADILGVGEKYRAVDLQFACKAATAGIQMAMGEVTGNHHKYALVIGTDKAQARPGDVLEVSAGAAAAALVIGKTEVLARVTDSLSITSDTPDFWRRAQEKYPQHAGRFSGLPGYFEHVLTAGGKLMLRNGITPKEIKYAIAHMPNGRFPKEALGKLGFKPEQYEDFLTVEAVGNPYAASTMLGLVAVMEKLAPKERVLMIAYGSGAGADAMLLEGTVEIGKRRWRGLERQFKDRVKIDKLTYLQRNIWE